MPTFLAFNHSTFKLTRGSVRGILDEKPFANRFVRSLSRHCVSLNCKVLILKPASDFAEDSLGL